MMVLYKYIINAYDEFKDDGITMTIRAHCKNEALDITQSIGRLYNEYEVISKEPIMIIHCEICALRDGEKLRIGEHTKLGEAIDIHLPLNGNMFGSPNPERQIPPPFRGIDNWRDMKCPRCRRIPFMFTPDQLDHYDKQGGPDRVYTDEGWMELDKPRNEE